MQSPWCQVETVRKKMLQSLNMELGYTCLKSFVDEAHASKLETILRKYHNSWLAKYQDNYQQGSINSAYITNGEFLTTEERLELLKFVSSKLVIQEAQKILGNDLCFLNTQLFFNPFDKDQKNYWHRDIQYTGLSENEQRLTIEAKQTEVIHLRLALSPELGIEFIPGTHHRWDRPYELEVRLQQNGKQSSDTISGSKSAPLERGDLLLFDANIIHRGLYGKDRFAFDLLFCKPLPQILKFLDTKCLPSSEELKFVECPEVFRLI